MMIMMIQFGVTNDERTKLSKTFTVVTELQGHLKEETPVNAPVVRVTADVLNNCNYAYIPDFNRYYFIASPFTSVRTNLYEVALKCDVLNSFKDQIKNIKIIAERSTSAFNGYYVDPEKKFLAYPDNQYIYLGSVGTFGNVMLLGVG